MSETKKEGSKFVALAQQNGLWSLAVNGTIVMRDESYAVVHGIVEDAEVRELQEIRDSLQ